MAFDASPSWSGFNYQGKVALYCALKAINKEPVESDLSNYHLMLENTEDFELWHDEAPISVHQVKAYNSSSYSKYTNALVAITLELYKQDGVKGWVHTWKPINSKTGTASLAASVKDDFRAIIEEYDNTNPKDGSSILEKATSGEKNIPKLAAILRTAFEGFTSKELYKVIDSILHEQNDAIARLASYRYEDNNEFCDLNEIDNKIKSEIAEAMQARELTVTEEQKKKTFFYFLGMMDRYIIQRHKRKQSSEKIPIAFNEIIHGLEIDHEDIGTEYLTCKFKEQFARLIDEYTTGPDYHDEPVDQLCNLKEAKKALLSLSPKELWSHYRNFSPHIYLEYDNNLDNAISTDRLGIRYVLIKAFHQMNIERASHDASKNRFTYRASTPPYQNYLPTTITSLPSVREIEREIISNRSMSEVLFEIENLIYGGSDVHTLYPGSVEHTEAPPSEDEDPRSKRDEILKHITLVPIPAAKDALA
ncbi:ABC-three component system protein [Idiomarina sp.]|uniref:ABC-three component system protein n=1 Tax=Idiomarina sp. TaxID=1874361 RepID=UPI0025C2976C|nr:ABC-three component system protein [Idiomarina sp.]